MGQGTVLVPAAHGPRGEKPPDPARVESPASQGQHGNKKQESAARFDPFRVGKINGSLTVGGGHQKRALAHGYSVFTPSGWEDRRHPELHTPRVQPTMWDMLSPWGERVAESRVRGHFLAFFTTPPNASRIVRLRLFRLARPFPATYNWWFRLTLPELAVRSTLECGGSTPPYNRTGSIAEAAWGGRWR